MKECENTYVLYSFAHCIGVGATLPASIHAHMHIRARLIYMAIFLILSAVWMSRPLAYYIRCLRLLIGRRC